MKKIYSKTVFEFNKKTGLYEVNENESQFHYISDDAPISQMKGSSNNNNNRPVTQVQKQEPWSEQIPYLKEGMQQANKFFIHDPNYFYYPGNLVAPFSPETEEAYSGILNLARQGNPYLQGTEDVLSKTMNGDYLTGGSGFNAALEAAKKAIIPGIQSQFESRGRMGSGLSREAEASGIGDAFSKLYGQERQNQLKAAAMAPYLAPLRYAGFEKIADIGKQRELMNQSNIEAEKERFDWNQNARRNLILNYLNAVSGGYGGNITTLSNSGGGSSLSPWARYLGGAASGAMMGSPYGGYGALAGGGLGLLSAFL